MNGKGSFFQSKFDNICLMLLIVLLVSLLTWADKHNNGDFVKWLEVFTAGIGGAYLGLITASRQAWQKTVNQLGAPIPPHCRRRQILLMGRRNDGRDSAGLAAGSEWGYL